MTQRMNIPSDSKEDSEETLRLVKTRCIAAGVCARRRDHKLVNPKILPVLTEEAGYGGHKVRGLASQEGATLSSG